MKAIFHTFRGLTDTNDHLDLLVVEAVNFISLHTIVEDVWLLQKKKKVGGVAGE